jgi:O-antigen ligase
MMGYWVQTQRSVKVHSLSQLIGLIVLIAALSTFKLPPASHLAGFINLTVLVFMLIFTISVYNVLLLREEHLVYLLRFFAYSAAVAAIWVIIDGIQSEGVVSASGPFRNRAHAGVYMLTSFWVILLNITWPGTSRKERWIFYGILPLIFYCVAVSGRRSIYIATFIGFGALFASFIIAPGRGRSKILVTMCLFLAAFAILYFVMSDYWNPARFFKSRVEMIDTRLEAATTFTGEGEYSESFSALQYRGIFRAFRENPVLGIGWGGFFESEYSLTGHEVHSTPLRFLAETGLVGFLLYLCFVFRLLYRSFKLWLASRRTVYQFPALILFIAFCSASLSAYYNRQVTERTFWLLLVIFMGFETLLLRKIRRESLPIRSQ